MASRIEHSGVVERTERDTVYVRITSHSACGSCKAREACGLAEAQDKIVVVKSPDAAQFAVGELKRYWYIKTLQKKPCLQSGQSSIKNK